MDRELIRLGARIELARREFFFYCNLKAPDFYKPERTYLVDLCNSFQKFLADPDEKVMIVNEPPRHGKSRTAGMLVEWILGRDRTKKVMTGSYNETLSTTFSKNVRNSIMEVKADKFRPVFSDVFPGVTIKRGDGAMNLWSLEGGYNNYLATSPTGTATGFGADIMIIDDLIKNAGVVRIRVTDSDEVTVTPMSRVASEAAFGEVKAAAATSNDTVPVHIKPDGTLAVPTYPTAGSGVSCAGVYSAAAEGIANDGTDCTASLQALIDRVWNAGGGVIILEKGIYAVTSLNIRSKVSIIGQGMANTIIWHLGGASDRGIIYVPIYSMDFTLEDFTIYGNVEAAGDTIDGIYFPEILKENGEPRYNGSYQPEMGGIFDYVINHGKIEDTFIATYKNCYINRVAVFKCGGWGIYAGVVNFNINGSNLYLYNNQNGLMAGCTDCKFDTVYCEYNKSHGIMATGGNNKWSNIKSLWNSWNDNAGWGIHVTAERNAFSNVEVQDNYASGVYVGGVNNMFSNLLCDYNGYNISWADLLYVTGSGHRIMASCTNYTKGEHMPKYAVRMEECTGCHIDAIIGDNASTDGSIIDDTQCFVIGKSSGGSSGGSTGGSTGDGGDTGDTGAKTYNLTNGTLTVSNTNPAAGETFTMTFAPSSGNEAKIMIADLPGLSNWITSDIAYNGATAEWSVALSTAGSYGLYTAVDGTVNYDEVVTLTVGGSSSSGSSSGESSSGKNIAILGDSYSTYYGYIPDGYLSWYAATGVDGENTAENNVNSVEQTWWKLLMAEKGYDLLVNSSYSGSCICNTSFNGADGTATSFITRAANDLDNMATEPDIIFVFGATNDSGAGCPVGSLKYSDWTTDDLKQVLPAVCYLLNWLKNKHPNSTIIFITNGFVGSYNEMYISQEIRDGIASACAHYGVKNILVEGKEGTECTNVHPNQTGMIKIKDTIVANMQ